MIVYSGFQNGKFQVSETESGVKLDFLGRDADRFEQLNAADSNSVKRVAKVEWTVNAFCEQMVHNFPDRVKALLHNVRPRLRAFSALPSPSKWCETDAATGVCHCCLTKEAILKSLAGIGAIPEPLLFFGQAQENYDNLVTVRSVIHDFNAALAVLEMEGKIGRNDMEVWLTESEPNNTPVKTDDRSGGPKEIGEAVQPNA